MSHTTLSEISTDIVKLPLQLNIVVFRNGLVRVFALICDIFGRVTSLTDLRLFLHAV